MRKRDLEAQLAKAQDELERAEERVADLTALLADGIYDDEPTD